MWVEEASRMPDGSEFQTAGAATLKPQEAKVVQTRGADNRLVFAERRERVGIKKGVEVRMLSGAESVGTWKVCFRACDQESAVILSRINSNRVV